MTLLLAIAIYKNVSGIPENLVILKRLVRNKYSDGELFSILLKKRVLKIKTLIFLKKESISAIIRKNNEFQKNNFQYSKQYPRRKEHSLCFAFFLINGIFNQVEFFRLLFLRRRV